MPFLAQEHYPIPHSDINSWLFDTPRYDWDEPIYIDGTRPKDNFIAARKAKATIRRLVAGLRRLGLQQGDAVDLHSFNHIYYPILFLGVIAAGGVFVGTNPAYTPYELKHAFKIAKVKWVFCAPDLLAPVEKAMSELSLSKDCLALFNPDGNGATPGYKQWSDLLVHGEQDWIRFNDLRKAKETEASRMFSSGTTGLPKAASVSHHNLIAQHVLVFEANPRPWRACRLLSLPMFHAATAPAAYCTPLREGSKAYVFPRFDLEQWFRCSEEYGVTDLVAVPPVVVAAINSPLRHKYSLKSVRDCKAGAAPLDAKAQARLQALLGDAPFTQVWGMTETTCIATRFKWPNTDTTGSVGYPIPNIDLKLVDDDGKDISRDDIRGELCIRGPTVVTGYYENEEANKRDWDQEGFFHTGDIAYRDGRTKLWYIVDRKKVSALHHLSKDGISY